ncbi:restriction endonuclease subunit S [uncultured Thiodictyon sp.]|jgi:type I restriction enzyme S subunit|uniref:restriction endonuclease subunit S n=1 Tax=uncultured Thiodictyon sp. TaxID=1846217 RepID=UPI0025EE0356|nr:restriction endonuclease subunit S [uncultured Thiodictyon sp.]
MDLTKAVDEIIAEDRTGLLAKHLSWERVALRDVATVLNGYPFDSAHFNRVFGAPLICIRDVVSGSTNTFYSAPFDEQFLVNRGDLIVGMDGDFNSARWCSAPGLLNQRVCKISSHDHVYSGKLLEYALPGYLAAINAATSSITVKHLSSRTIEDISLPLPPRKEQERIVERLEEVLSDLDDGIAELKAAQKKLVQYRQSLLKAAVDGTLTASWREAPKSATRRAERNRRPVARAYPRRTTRPLGSQAARQVCRTKQDPV